MPNPRITFETTHGSFRVELFADESPRVASGFLSMVDEGAFSNMAFQRIVPEFMLEAGHPENEAGPGEPGAHQVDPEAEGRGSPGSTVIEHTDDWALSMTEVGGGPHLFLTLTGTPWLDERHAVLGRVVEGTRVVRAIGRVDADVQGRPHEDIWLRTVRREA